MEFPKLVYDDFYKFLMSSGIVLLLIGIGLTIYIAETPTLNTNLIFTIFPILLLGSGIVFMIFAGKKWQKNQNVLDARYEFENDKLKAEKAKLVAETQLIQESSQETIGPKQEIEKKRVEGKISVTEEKIKDRANVALVSYKIAQHFPELNTIPFDFLKDWKVWFLIRNYEINKYKAYIKIKFITSDGYEEDAGGHYGGTVAWRLNAFSVIIAPGLGIPEKIREKIKQGNGIKISILGEIKDEDDNLIEKKLPMEYIYDSKNNSWYYEP